MGGAELRFRFMDERIDERLLQGAHEAGGEAVVPRIGLKGFVGEIVKGRAVYLFQIDPLAEELVVFS